MLLNFVFIKNKYRNLKYIMKRSIQVIFYFGKNSVLGPALELDAISSCLLCGINQFPGKVHIAVVVGTQFGDDIRLFSFF